MYHEYYFVIRGNDHLRQSLRDVDRELGWHDDLCDVQIWKTQTSTRGMDRSEMESLALCQVKKSFLKFYRRELAVTNAPTHDPISFLRQSLAHSQLDDAFEEWWEIIAVTTELVDADRVNH